MHNIKLLQDYKMRVAKVKKKERPFKQISDKSICVINMEKNFLKLPGSTSRLPAEILPEKK